MTDWQIESDAAAVADAACRRIGMAAREAIERHGRFNLVLAGGSTPLDAYARLASSEQDWRRWALFYGDERCLPADDPQRNSMQVAATGLAARVRKHYPIDTEQGCKAAARAYRERIASIMPFDMVILGMGEDGHTASLFPERDWPDKTVFTVKDSPKPPAHRVTLGLKALQACHNMLVLVTGETKADAVQQWRENADLPIARVSALPQATVLVERQCLRPAHVQSDTDKEPADSDA